MPGGTKEKSSFQKKQPKHMKKKDRSKTKTINLGITCALIHVFFLSCSAEMFAFSKNFRGTLWSKDSGSFSNSTEGSTSWSIYRRILNSSYKHFYFNWYVLQVLESFCPSYRDMGLWVRLNQLFKCHFLLLFPDSPASTSPSDAPYSSLCWQSPGPLCHPRVYLCWCAWRHILANLRRLNDILPASQVSSLYTERKQSVIAWDRNEGEHAREKTQQLNRLTFSFPCIFLASIRRFLRVHSTSGPSCFRAILISSTGIFDSCFSERDVILMPNSLSASAMLPFDNQESMSFSFSLSQER